MSRRNHFKRAQKKRYATRRFENPYHSKKTEKKQVPVGLILILVPILVIGGMIFALMSKTFHVTSIRVHGLETIEEQEITEKVKSFLEERRFFVSRQANRFALNHEALKDVLEEDYTFESLETSVDGKVLVIELREKTSQLLWLSGREYYLVDLHGEVIRKLTSEERSMLKEPDPEEPEPIIEVDEEGNEVVILPEPLPPPPPIKRLPIFIDLNNIDIRIGRAVLTGDEVTNIFRFHEHLEAQDIAFVETRIDRLAGQWMSVVTEDGYDILFDPTGDIDQQATNLEVTIRDTIGGTVDLEYIDLRFGDHVYYK